MSHTLYQGDQNFQTFIYVTLVCSIVGSIASILLLVLIKQMQIWNGHILLLTTMSIFQLIYDLSFFNATISSVGTFDVGVVFSVLLLFFGIASALSSNFIAFTATYVVYWKRSLDIFRYYPWMLTIAIVPALVTAIIYIISFDHSISNYSYLNQVVVLDLYIFIRLISLITNFVLSFTTFYLVRRMDSHNKVKSPQEIAITTLSYRLIYYPVIQTVSRIGCGWYQVKYGDNFAVSGASREQFAAQLTSAILTPFASVGYLVIFVMMQPNAKSTLIKLLTLNRYGHPSIGNNERITETRLSENTSHIGNYDNNEFNNDNNTVRSDNLSSTINQSRHMKRSSSLFPKMNSLTGFSLFNTHLLSVEDDRDDNILFHEINRKFIDNSLQKDEENINRINIDTNHDSMSQIATVSPMFSTKVNGVESGPS
eukprot:gene14726-19794_t